MGLDLFGTPSSIGIPHIRRWLNGRHELQGSESDANEDDDAADDETERARTHDDATNEDVNCGVVSIAPCWTTQHDVQRPRPRNENRKLAYLGR